MSEQSYAGGERRLSAVALVQEISELRAAVSVLSARTDALAGGLEKVNDINSQQQDVDRRSAEAVYTAATALATVNDTKLAVEDAQKKHAIEVGKQLALQRNRMMRRFYGLAVVGTVVVLTAVVGAVSYATGQSAYKSDLYQLCLERSKQSAAINSVLSKPPAVPLTESQKEDAAKLKEAFKPVDCGRVAP